MIELISILCSLMICVLTPIEVGRIRGGWVNKKFENDRPKFLAAYSRQLAMLTWVGVGFGVLTLGLVAIEHNPGERIVKMVAGVIWLAVAAICFIYRKRLPTVA
jgi:hypothetical protein